MVNQEFQIVTNELDDGSKTYDAVAFAGKYRVTFNAVDKTGAVRIADACNSGANAFIVEEAPIAAGQQSYIESTIDACGRRFGIRVSNGAFPFQVGRMVGNGDEFEGMSTHFANRSDAIKSLTGYALAWLGN